MKVKTSIEVMAIHYNHNIILDEVLKLLRTNKNEPAWYDEMDKQFISRKNVEKLF